MTNLFYFKDLNAIGGVETFFYYMAKKYNVTHDITIVYVNADLAQLIRLSKYAKCIKYVGQKFKCKKVFFNYNMDIINDVEAEEYYAIIHGDYLDYGITPLQHPKIKKYIGVSDIATNSFKTILPDKDIQRIYNPLAPDKPQKTLLLVSATRLSGEKGLERIKKLAQKLDENGRPWLWLIFTPSGGTFWNKNIMFLSPRMNIIDYINKCDYLIQLSDAEGYGYSVAEALSIRKPVIVTDIPAMHEIGVQDGINGFVLKKDLSNVDVNKFYDNTLLFSYTPPQDEWNKILAKRESKYEKEMTITMISIQAKRDYTDTQLNKDITEGDVYSVTPERATQIVSAGLADIIEITEEVVEEENELQGKKVATKKKTNTNKR